MKPSDIVIQLKYPNAERFANDYPLIRTGKVFIPTTRPLKRGTILFLDVSLPEFEETYTLRGLVQKVLDAEQAKEMKRSPGMIIFLTKDAEQVLISLDRVLRDNPTYKMLLGEHIPKEKAVKPDEGLIDLESIAPRRTAAESEQEQPPAPPQPPAPSEKEPEPYQGPLTEVGPAEKQAEPPSAPEVVVGEDVGPDQSQQPAVPPQAVQDYQGEITEITPGREEAGAQAAQDVAVGETVTTADPGPAASSPDVQEYKGPMTEVSPDPAGAQAAPGKPATPEVEERVEYEEAPHGAGGLKLVWLRRIVGKEDIEDVEEEEPEEKPKAIVDRKVLTEAERERLKPVAEFIMDLTRAMLKSGYYAPDHPGSKQAKGGLYDEFLKAVGDDREIMMSTQQTQERFDIMVIGVLDEPVSVRVVIGPGMAELFVPKIREYFERKALISLAIKKIITLDHFNSFVDVMSDPHADTSEITDVGQLLTSALIKHGITEISTVFMDDIFMLDKRLPWRVQMAIQRLAKDLKVLPMFEGSSIEEVRQFKLQTVQDVLRTIRQPQYLKDILINSYIIAQNVPSMDNEEMEQMIVHAVPGPLLLPSSRLVFDEMLGVRELKKEHADRIEVIERFDSLRRNLNSVAKRLISDQVPGSLRFIEQLFFEDIIPFSELPPKVQYRINTIRLANDIRARPDDYIGTLMEVTQSDDVMVFVRCFRRVAPLFIEQVAWQDLIMIVDLVKRASMENEAFRAGNGIPDDPVDFILLGKYTALAEAYDTADKGERQKMSELLLSMERRGVQVLSEVLIKSEDIGARKSAVADLVKMGDSSLSWVRHVLDDPTKAWFLQRNGLLILGEVGGGEKDNGRARRFVKHSNPRLREEALNSVVKLEGRGAERIVIEALNDQDQKVQRRAMSFLTQLQPLSDKTCQEILVMITSEAPKDKDEAKAHNRKVAQMIRAIGAMSELPPNLKDVEEVLLSLVEQKSGKRGGVLQRLRKAADQGDAVILGAAVDTLGKIGTTKSLFLLEKLASEEGQMAKRAENAGNRIKLRFEG